MAKWWENRDLWIGVLGFGGLVTGLQLAGYNPVGVAAFAVKDVFVKGSRLSYGTLDPALGIVVDTPEALRAAASARFGQDLDRNTYAAARMVRSEGAKEGNLRVHVALNDLMALGWSDLFTLLTYSTDALRKGNYGKQYSAAAPPMYPNKMVRRYATSQDPYEGDIKTVLDAFAEHDSGIDPSEGATKFLDRSSFGVQEGTGSFEAKNTAWVADGLQPFTVDAYGDDLVLYRRA